MELVEMKKKINVPNLLKEYIMVLVLIALIERAFAVSAERKKV